MRALAVCLICFAADARADGYYYEQSYGIASAPDANMIGTTLRLRLGVGIRRGRRALEPWFAAHLAFDRVDATYGVIGGQPAAGHADLSGMGFDVRYTQPIVDHLAVYVLGGPRAGSGEGALDRY